VPSRSSIQSAAVPNVRSLLGGRPMLFCICIFEDFDAASDFTFLATGGSDGVLSCFAFKPDPQWANTVTWKPTVTIEAHQGRAVTAAAVAWKRLYTAGSDGTIKVWEMEFEEKETSVMEKGVKITISIKKTGVIGLALAVTVPVHAGPVSSLISLGGILFSASHDMSLVPWLEPEKKVDPDNPTRLRLYQESTEGIVSHNGAITTMHGNSDMLITADVAGGIVIRVPTEITDKIKTGARPNQDEDDVGRKKKGGGMVVDRQAKPAEGDQAAGGKASKAVHCWLQGLDRSLPDFLDEVSLVAMDKEHKKFLARYYAHVFPQRVIGVQRKGSIVGMDAQAAAKTPAGGGADGAFGENFVTTPRVDGPPVLTPREVEMTERKG
jgi:hypothetical protein